MKLPFLILAAAALVAPAALFAHHGPGDYDQTRTVTLEGSVREANWMNPHVTFFLSVPDATGKTAIWMVEMAPPNTLRRLGLNKEDLKDGEHLKLEVWTARNGSFKAAARVIMLPDGRQINNPAGWPTPTPSLR